MWNNMYKLWLSILVGLWLSGTAQTQTTISDALKNSLDTSYTATHIDTSKAVSQELMEFLDIEDLEKKIISELSQTQINMLANKFINVIRKEYKLDTLQINNNLCKQNQSIAELWNIWHTPYLQQELTTRWITQEWRELLSLGYTDRTVQQFIDELIASKNHFNELKNPSHTQCSLVIRPYDQEKNHADAQLLLIK